MADVRPDSTGTDDLLERAAGGSRSAFDQLFAQCRGFLEDRIAGRLDRRLQARFDPADIVQETQLEAYRRFADYARRRPMPFHLWLWKTAYERMLNLRRDHLRAARRSVTREVPLPERSSMQLALHLCATTASPSAEAAQKEHALAVRQALVHLSEEDREILLLRYVDGLSNQDIALMLEISSGAVSKRHGRALLRMQQLLDGLGWGGQSR